MASLDRALFSSSLKPISFTSPSHFLVNRTATRHTSALDFDNNRARFLIEQFECHSRQHLQIACLALQLSEGHGWPKENACLSAAASLLGLLHSLNSVVSFNPNPKRKDRACQCSSAGYRSSFNDAGEASFVPAASSGLKAGDERLCSKETQNRWHGTAEDGDGNGSQVQYLEKGVAIGDPRSYFVSDQTIDDGGAKAGQVKRRETLSSSLSSSVDTVSIPVKEPIYEVLEVNPGGDAVTKSVSRRLLLKSSGLRLRDIRSVDPSLWVTNSAPALLIRDQAILLNLGSLRAIATPENVLIFDHRSIGAAVFLELLLQRLNPDSNPSVPTMPFELEVVEAALLSRTQRLERRLMEVEPRVLSLLEVLPNRLTANVLEELRLSKQALVELGSKAGALRQMLLDLLESPQEIRRMTIMGRGCTIRKEDGSIECSVSSDKQLADDEEEEMEMLLENYLQRCESCHGQAERLLDSAKEMEDSIAVNLSSRRLEVSRLELLLQVGTFCSALGALVAGIFGMNLRSYLEGSAFAFWLTAAGIILGGIILFFVMYSHLKQRKIL